MLMADGCRKDLDTVAVRMLINGEEKASGTGAEVLGHPINSLTWLANSLNKPGISSSSAAGGAQSGLLAGDFVMAGAAVFLPKGEGAFKDGDEVVAMFDGMGEVAAVL